MSNNIGFETSVLRRNATDFLFLLLEYSSANPEVVTPSLWFALLSAGFAPHTGLPAVVEIAKSRLLRLPRKEVVPELVKVSITGLSAFYESGEGDDSVDYQSWNAAFLLVEMSKMDGNMWVSEAGMDLLCLIMTYDADSQPSNDQFVYTSAVTEAFAGLPDDDVARALIRRSEKNGYRRERVAIELSDLAERQSHRLRGTTIARRFKSMDNDPTVSQVLDSGCWSNQPNGFERIVRGSRKSSKPGAIILRVSRCSANHHDRSESSAAGQT